MILNILIILAILLAFFFSMQYRTFKNPLMRSMGKALTNVAMGMALLFLSLKIFLGDLSTAQLIVGFLFIFIGFVNVWMGVKNYRFYRSSWQQEQKG